MSTIEILNDIFRTVFDNPNATVSPEMTANDVEGWEFVFSCKLNSCN